MMVKEQVEWDEVKSTGEMGTLKIKERNLILWDQKNKRQGLEVYMFVTLEQKVKNHFFLSQFCQWSDETWLMA